MFVNFLFLFLLVVPCRNRLSYSIRSDKKSKRSAFEIDSTAFYAEEDKLCVISEVEGCQSQDPTARSQNKSDSSVKVPIFVLHPSGTHYIPMSIDASIVSDAFNKSSLSRTSSTSTTAGHEQIQCHPVSIPVNFNPISSLSDPYELEIQNINVIGTRHQTSVRPT